MVKTKIQNAQKRRKDQELLEQLMVAQQEVEAEEVQEADQET